MWPRTEHYNGQLTAFKYFVNYLENRNYNVSVLRKDILTKQAAKEAEYNFIKGYGADCVNKKTPLLVDFKQYQREYQHNFRKKKRLLSEQESTE